jgi:small-conductance mechanosensitive channel
MYPEVGRHSGGLIDKLCLTALKRNNSVGIIGEFIYIFIVNRKPMSRIEAFFSGLGNNSLRMIAIALIIIAAVIFTRLFHWLINKVARKGAQESPLEATRLSFVKNGISIIVWMIAIGGIIYTIPKLRAMAVTLFAGAGILLAIVGFAAQQAFANVIGGIFIVIFKPFRVGDFIKVGNLDYGWVEDITLRHTTIKSFQNRRIIVPNSTISSENIVNDTIEDPKVCRWIEVGISYDSDIDRAMEIMREEAMKHSFCIDNRSDEERADGVPVVDVRVTELGEYWILLRAFVWAENTPNAIMMHHHLNKSIKERFDKEDIEIPFPYRTIVYKSDIPRKTAD